ncbi:MULTISPECIES: sugar phosphate isomerase/epimerase family protein [unclassified Nocardioides]|uniref:sugar phosphate isomerase/epimerase family protein n=1 Tax=unclassified Nocardioides TaxID=2615069 RepID=UPI0009EFD291|nr:MULTISPECIES: TIM barrel protein [unclassified Nocardioides]GAW47987.1 hypothetical protein PD653B2_0298 [Nocardioides sp. PD653-B2]GAW53710.1 hypothetical protein PD653_1113 [Nocardioides sp. PD653]
MTSMSSVPAAPEYSLSSLNWVDFGSDAPADRRSRATRPLTEVLKAAAASGFGHVGVDLESVTFGTTPEAFTADLVSGLAEEFRIWELECSDVGILMLGSPRTQDDAQRLVELADALGGSFCLSTFAGAVTDESVAQLRRCAAMFQEVGTRIALEFIPFGPLDSCATATSICAEVGWERCGLLLDSYHVCHAGEVEIQLRGLSGEQVAFVQLADGLVEEGVSPASLARRRRLPAGYGQLDVNGFVRRVSSLGWSGPISPEVLSDDFRATAPALGAALLHASARLAWELPEVTDDLTIGAPTHHRDDHRAVHSRPSWAN